MFENSRRLVSVIHLKTVDIACANGQIEDVLAMNVFKCWIAKTVGDVCKEDEMSMDGETSSLVSLSVTLGCVSV